MTSFEKDQTAPKSQLYTPTQSNVPPDEDQLWYETWGNVNKLANLITK